MKKAIVCLLAALSVAAVLTSCGSKQCNICEKSCSDKHSYFDGEVVICSSCYKKCFDTKTEVDADVFFADAELAYAEK
ncbi:MAG: hypothetical protein ACI4RV_01120 [Eubacteriales bacterium]